jgi:hypothetical protein
MRKVSSATVAVILGVALYFTLFWGFDALRMLTSPTCGLEDVWRSQFVFGTGRVFGLGPMGLIQLAAFFGTLKLAVAGICAVHIVDRFRCLAGGKAASEILEGGLILVVLVTSRRSARRCGRTIATWCASRPSSFCSPALPPRSASSSAATVARPRPTNRMLRRPRPRRRQARLGSRPGAEGARASNASDFEYCRSSSVRTGYFALATSAITSAASLKAWLAAGTPQ